MRLRLSTAIGTFIVDDTEQRIGVITGVCIHPDTCILEGFFVLVAGFLRTQTLFLPISGIEYWGRRVRIRNEHVLAPVDELFRVSRLIEEERPVYLQRIQTEAGVYLGNCKDLQFDTRTFRVEWLFPRRFFRWGVPIPVSAILQVTPIAVVVQKDLTVPLTEEGATQVPSIDALSTTPVARIGE